MANNTKKVIDQNINLTKAAIYSNGFTTYTPWNQSTAFRTAATAYRQQELRLSLAENFLINTNNYRNNPQNSYSILSYLDDRGMVMVSNNGKECIDKQKKFFLPAGIPLDISLGEAITSRRSKRSYTGDSCHVNYLSSIIRAGAGISTKAHVRLMSEGSVSFHFKTVPSAGGLYPVEIYIAAVNIDGISKGIYRYQSQQDCLIHVGDEAKLDNLMATFDVPDEIINYRYANAIILLVAQPWKTMRKYNDRGLRFVFHEAGAITQNIHLAVTALGLGSVDCASICEDEANDVLGFDGKFQSIIHSIIIGSTG